MPSFEGSVEQQDSRGWTPIMWSASNGYSQLVKQLIQRGSNVTHMGQAKSGSGTTMALHECAAMRGEGGQSQEAFFETAWLLMSAGASPFAERSDGRTAIEVAALMGQVRMKAFLETCSLFRGTMALPVPQTFGSKTKNRYCTVQPRFPFGNAAPTLWMVCYRNPNETMPVCKIPLSNARVMVEGPQDSINGIIIIPGSGKALKGVAVKSHTSNSFIIEIRAIGTASMPGWKTLRTLADVCKAAAVAVACRNLDQLCAAALRQATRQMYVPGTESKAGAEQAAPPSVASASSAQTEKPPPVQPGPAVKAEAKPAASDAQKAGPMTDSAKDFTAEDLMPTPSLTSAGSQALESLTEPDTPRSSRASEAPRRTSGLGKLFMNTFRRSSMANRQRYNSQLLDSQQSLGQMSTASGAEKARKQGLWSGLKRSMSAKPLSAGMPSITEQTSGGLTAEDIGALSQPIPDKFWSKIGRKMSSQQVQKPMLRPGAAPQNWFHSDEGNSSGAFPQPARPRRSFNYDDLDELMYPGKPPEEAQGEVPESGNRQPVNVRRQTADNIRASAAANGTVAFILEEPIVPTQQMVPTGPRRSFSFDDLDDLVSGASRKARGHREGFQAQMAPSAAVQNPANSQSQQQARQNDLRVPMQEGGSMPTAPTQRQAPQSNSRRFLQGPMQPQRIPAQNLNTMPRRSFSLHDMDALLKPLPQPQPSQQQPPATVQDELQAWRLNQQRQAAAANAKRRGPAIDPYSHGGYQGAPAPEWRPYRPPSAQAASHSQAAAVAARPPQATLNPQAIPRVVTRHPGQHAVPTHVYPVGQIKQGQLLPHGQQSQHAAVAQPQVQNNVAAASFRPNLDRAPADGAGQITGTRSSKSAEDAIPPELAHLASLRALETENMSTTSGKGDDKASSSQTASQDLLGQDLFTSAQGLDRPVQPSAPESPKPEQIQASTAALQPPATPEPSPTKPVVRVSPAVPAVLFQGVKLPKIATPPQRIAREAEKVPDFPSPQAAEPSS